MYRGGREGMEGRLVGRGGQVTQPGEPPHEDGPHELAGSEDLRIGQAIADGSPVADRLHEADGPHRRKVLGGRGLVQAELAGDLVDFGRLGACLLYTSDAADDLTRVAPGGRRAIKKK